MFLSSIDLQLKKTFTVMTNKIRPIKRSEELVSLSREHHDGLLLCWKIKEGLSRDISVDRIVNYILSFFDKQLAQHFKEEEQFIFPLLSSDNAERREAELHHKILLEMVGNFREVHHLDRFSLKRFAEQLNEHIRFEERVLFPLIELEAEPESLQLAATHLSAQTNRNMEWEDEFWVKKNETDVFKNL